MVDFEHIRELMQCFAGCSINHEGYICLNNKSNDFFYIVNCECRFDIMCNVLEFFSRSACKAQPYVSEKRNREYCQNMLDKVNKYLGTNFSTDEMMEIYTYLGNRCNHKKTEKFIESGYDMDVLYKEIKND